MLLQCSRKDLKEVTNPPSLEGPLSTLQPAEGGDPCQLHGQEVSKRSYQMVGTITLAAGTVRRTSTAIPHLVCVITLRVG